MTERGSVIATRTVAAATFDRRVVLASRAYRALARDAVEVGASVIAFLLACAISFAVVVRPPIAMAARSLRVRAPEVPLWASRALCGSDCAAVLAGVANGALGCTGLAVSARSAVLTSGSADGKVLTGYKEIRSRSVHQKQPGKARSKKSRTWTALKRGASDTSAIYILVWPTGWHAGEHRTRTNRQLVYIHSRASQSERRRQIRHTSDLNRITITIQTNACDALEATQARQGSSTKNVHAAR